MWEKMRGGDLLSGVMSVVLVAVEVSKGMKGLN